MTQSKTTESPVEKQEVNLTEESVKVKIKQMIVSLLNVGTRVSMYTTDMISNAHTFEQLNMTEHEKMRLIFQCDEFYGINLDASAIGVVRVGDLSSMVWATIQNKEKPPVFTQTDSTGA